MIGILAQILVRRRRSLVGLALLCALPAPSVLALDPSEPLRKRLEVGGEALVVGGEPVLAREAVRLFYERRGFELAWFDEEALAETAKMAVDAIGRATAHGLNPEDYHFELLTRRLTQIAAAPSSTAAQRVDFDLALTDALLMLGAHYLAGRLDPVTIDPQWFAVRRSVDLPALLETGLAEDDPAAALEGLLPRQRAYWRLAEALAEVRAVAAAGGWPAVPAGPLLRPGEQDARVPLLRARLLAPAGEDATTTAGTVYDSTLEEAVRRFQLRHALEPDGIVGPGTRAALNVSADERARQIAVNMERWRWLPADLGRRHLLVNIAGFWVQAVEDGQTKLEKKVIVGRQYRQTPVFSDSVSYIVLNPTWTLPPTILVKDKLPLIRQDPDYLIRQNYRVFRGFGAERVEIDPRTVDWSAVPARGFPYTLVQQPGPENALGQVKIMFPNRFDVYLHDTPARELFTRASRAFSSGCIRVSEVLDVAAWLTAPQGIGREGLDAILAGGQERTVRLSATVPVHLLYWTAWVDDEGRLFMVDDIYNRDGAVADALTQGPPGA